MTAAGRGEGCKGIMHQPATLQGFYNYFLWLLHTLIMANGWMDGGLFQGTWHVNGMGGGECTFVGKTRTMANLVVLNLPQTCPRLLFLKLIGGFAMAISITAVTKCSSNSHYEANDVCERHNAVSLSPGRRQTLADDNGACVSAEMTISINV